MNYKPIYEFLVWDNCHNKCKFCWQRKKPRLFNKEKREHILNEVIAFIDSERFIKGSHILICGGEIFDNACDFEALDIFFKTIVKKMNNLEIDLLYINTNLIYQDITGLYNLLKLIEENNLFERLKFTSSYDLEGRFKSLEDEELMLENLLKIKKDFKHCNIVINTILTKQVCQKIINKEFDVKHFSETYHCWVNLIPYIIYDENLAATRGEVMTALRAVENQNNGYLKIYINNFDLPQDKLLYIYENDNFEFCSCENSECGHSINFKRYSNKGSCFVCDLKEMFKGYY